MAKVEKIKTSIYLPSNLHWKFKEEVVKRRFASDTAAMEAAIREWIEGEDAGGPVTAAAFAEKNGRWHELLAQILASGDSEAIRAIQQNLRVLFRAVAGSSELHLERKPEQAARKKHES